MTKTNLTISLNVETVETLRKLKSCGFIDDMSGYIQRVIDKEFKESETSEKINKIALKLGLIELYKS